MATLTITTTAQQDQRIAAAFGHLLGLEGNANAAQVKALIIEHVRRVVHNYERDQNARTFVPPPLEPT
jgi:hypothetical protein